MRWWHWLLFAVAALLVLVGIWCISDLLRRVAYALALFVLAMAFATVS